MKQRGRKSAESMAAPKPTDISSKRPPPLASLTAEQAEVWQKVTSCYPPDYFRPSERDLLAMYCRHVVESGRLSRLVESVTDEGVKADLDGYAKLLQARDRETRAATALARSMRITHQSRTHKDTAASLRDKAAAEERSSTLWAG